MNISNLASPTRYKLGVFCCRNRQAVYTVSVIALCQYTTHDITTAEISRWQLAKRTFNGTNSEPKSFKINIITCFADSCFAKIVFCYFFTLWTATAGYQTCSAVFPWCSSSTRNIPDQWYFHRSAHCCLAHWFLQLHAALIRTGNCRRILTM